MARLHIHSLLSLFKVAVVDSVVLQKALSSGFSDFEDAAYAGVDYLVTRNIKDFKPAQLPVYLPDELEAIIRVK